MQKLEKFKEELQKLFGVTRISAIIKCGLTTLEKGRSRGDLMEAYKIITGKEALLWGRYFELVPNNDKVTPIHSIQVI